MTPDPEVRKAQERISRGALFDLLEYKPEEGVFLRKKTTRNRRFRAGTLAGGRNIEGYWRIRIERRWYLRSHLAWFYMTGEWPSILDHQDMDRANDRWSNLRIATKSQNQANTKIRARNQSGFKGVSPAGKRWRAQIKFQNRTIRLGFFDNPEAAHAAYSAAAHAIYGEFARVA